MFLQLYRDAMSAETPTTAIERPAANKQRRTSRAATCSPNNWDRPAGMLRTLLRMALRLP